MPRTARSAPASVDALDNINLDDMFDEDGDALFAGLDDGLDLGLDGIDDLGATGSQDNTEVPAESQSSPPEKPAAAEEVAEPRRRRARTRKSPFPYEDDANNDDEWEDSTPSKRKTRKKGQKPKVTKKAAGGRKAASVAAETPPKPRVTSVSSASTTASSAVTAASTKKKGGRAGTMPPPVARTNSANSVAAAGQFGGRLKRGAGGAKTKKITAASGPAPTAAGKAKGRPTPGPMGAVPAVPAPPPTSLAPVHPGLAVSPFCGLEPSKKLFYPFMPLPPEPLSIKRKLYSQLDRIHNALMSHLQSNSGKAADGIVAAQESEAIFLLLQEAFNVKSGTPAIPSGRRTETIGNAIGALRKTIPKLDNEKVTTDLQAVCFLLKRQHDFLKQNLANMEDWCKDNLSTEDYASVYLPPSKQQLLQPQEQLQRKRKEISRSGTTSVLASLSASAEISVKVTCLTYVSSKPLYAVLPPLFTPNDVAGSVGTGKPTKEAPPKKKRKLPTPSASTTSAATPPKPPVVTAKEPLPYVDLGPVRRRKCMADLLAKTARDLEAKHFGRIEEARQAQRRQQQEVSKVLLQPDQDTNMMLHTVGMWQWLQKSGYFGSSEAVMTSLGGVAAPPVDDKKPLSKCISEGKRRRKAEPSMIMDRLVSLLVDEQDGEDDDEEEIDLSVLEEGLPPQTELADLSGLSEEERCMLQLGSFGLVDVNRMVLEGDLSGGNKSEGMPKESPRRDSENGDVETLIDAMTEDLVGLNDLGNRRALYLEAAAKATLLSPDAAKRKSTQETSLIAKCQQVLKKSKEVKGKTGKAKTSKNDDLALPW